MSPGGVVELVDRPTPKQFVALQHRSEEIVRLVPCTAATVLKVHVELFSRAARASTSTNPPATHWPTAQQEIESRLLALREGRALSDQRVPRRTHSTLCVENWGDATATQYVELTQEIAGATGLCALAGDASFALDHRPAASTEANEPPVSVPLPTATQVLTVGHDTLVSSTGVVPRGLLGSVIDHDAL